MTAGVPIPPLNLSTSSSAGSGAEVQFSTGAFVFGNANELESAGPEQLTGGAARPAGGGMNAILLGGAALAAALLLRKR